MSKDNRRLDITIAAGALALVLLPWYRVHSGFYSFDWIGNAIGDPKLWPGLFLAADGRWQLWPVLGLLLLAAALRLTRAPGTRGGALVLIGAAGLGWLVAEGLSVGLRGWNWGRLEVVFGPVMGQPAFGAGAVVLALAFTGFIAFGFAERGR